MLGLIFLGLVPVVTLYLGHCDTLTLNQQNHGVAPKFYCNIGWAGNVNWYRGDWCIQNCLIALLLLAICLIFLIL